MTPALSAIPLSLYIHLPWCVRKCPYCDFNSHENRHNIQEEIYINALFRDLDTQLPSVWGRRLVSIFFGGGTPSLFSPHSIEKIMEGIYARFCFGPDIEITLEANPGTVDESRFSSFRRAGINRLSIGIQSLQDEKLQVLGRIHNREYALRAIDAAITAGFDYFNLDLMHGLPNQSITDAVNDLSDALAFRPPHVSWYQLTIEPNTLFHHQPPVLPPEEVLWTIQDKGKSLLAEHQLMQYEVSAYAQKGHECIHNTNYWEFGDYLGIGAGAHSKITLQGEERIQRHAQTKHPKEYINPQKQQTASTSILKQADIIFEFMLNALRLTRGVSAALFTERTKLPLSALEPILSEAKQKKLLVDDPHILQPTEWGQRFLNDAIAMFLPPS